MTTFVDAHPVARTRHQCLLCRRAIQPGEVYWRQAVFDEGSAWTHTTCEHCARVVYARTPCEEDVSRLFEAPTP